MTRDSGWMPELGAPLAFAQQSAWTSLPFVIAALQVSRQRAVVA